MATCHQVVELRANGRTLLPNSISLDSCRFLPECIVRSDQVYFADWLHLLGVSQCVREWAGPALDPAPPRPRDTYPLPAPRARCRPEGAGRGCGVNTERLGGSAQAAPSSAGALLPRGPVRLPRSGPPAVRRAPAPAEAPTRSPLVRCLLRSSWRLWDGSDPHVHTRGRGTESCVPLRPPVRGQAGGAGAQAPALPTAH